MSRYCPAECNTTESELAPKKEKYMSEHPPTVEKGALLTIVAATWMVRFEILHFNSCEHVDSGF